ncbi:DUF768 domain-containing protein [Mesorhizobium sp. M3A.F.Ca.ET.174.01.1.1]|nr:DUF768 domain-containing protein [Mesorhizobium sp. M3A.F.Ca.ET.201.01.1.1]TGS82420.1 DUF768 domain-containing protein [Mesorhizobium sp. M3A.F.Ca.ET.175.01.1.1]TGT22242.1 DUF768 domain-containing protein [Mesorhizobium sp. M3A.F.Ca.ET.174.01.1.1]
MVARLPRLVPAAGRHGVYVPDLPAAAMQHLSTLRPRLGFPQHERAGYRWIAEHLPNVIADDPAAIPDLVVELLAAAKRSPKRYTRRSTACFSS